VWSILWIKDEYSGEKPAWLTAQQWEAWVMGVIGGTDGPYHQIALHGSLEVLQWAAAKGCPLRKDGLCALAAQRGHLQMIQWARAQGCEWGPVTCRRAARHGHIEILNHLRNHGCEFPEDG
jgi:hypothetical protein